MRLEWLFNNIKDDDDFERLIEKLEEEHYTEEREE